jgi:phosphohistidine phosphatase
MGALILERDIVPEIILSSTAERARETVDLFAEATRFDGSIIYHRSIYHGYTSDYFDLLQTLDSRYDIAMVVGHNPGLEELLSSLVELDEWMPTSSIAQIDLDIDSWQGLGEYAIGVLKNLWRPRELN